MKTRDELKELALSCIDGFWGKSVLATVIVFMMGSVLMVSGRYFDTPVIPAAINLPFMVLVVLPLCLGYENAFKMLVLGGSGEISENMFSIGFERYWHNVGGMLLMVLYVLLWTLLLIVPGIIKALSCSMTTFILVDDPELSAAQAIRKSMKMMDGHKMELFLLCLSFVGWIFLGLVTLGLGFFAIAPYMEMTMAEFYLNLREEYTE